MFNKRGLSDVIATVLIILLALAAVVIVWGFIRPTITGIGGAIDLRQKCLLAEVKPTSCTYVTGTTSATVSVQRVKGDMKFIIAVVEDANGATNVSQEDAPQALGTQTFTITTGATPSVARAAAVVVDPNDATRIATCDESLFVENCRAVTAP